MQPPDEILTIVAGVDGSETSMRAGAYAAGMARRMRARLVVVFVHVIGGLAAGAPGVVPAVLATQRDIAAELRATLDQARLTPELEIAFLERQGNPYRELVAVATELRADAVVVGASTQAGHRLVGSLAVHLVRDAMWPVTVVP